MVDSKLFLKDRIPSAHPFSVIFSLNISNERKSDKSNVLSVLSSSGTLIYNLARLTSLLSVHYS